MPANETSTETVMTDETQQTPAPASEQTLESQPTLSADQAFEAAFNDATPAPEAGAGAGAAPIEATEGEPAATASKPEGEASSQEQGASAEAGTSRRGAAKTIAEQQKTIEQLVAEKAAAAQATAEAEARAAAIQQRQAEAEAAVRSELGDDAEMQKRIRLNARGELSYEEQEELSGWLEAREKFAARQNLAISQISGVMHGYLNRQGVGPDALQAIQTATDPEGLFSAYWQTAYGAGAAKKEAELSERVSTAEAKATALEADNRALRARTLGAASRPILGGRSSGVGIPGGSFDPRKTADQNFEAAFSEAA